MRLLLVSSRRRSGEWIRRVEQCGWTADWIDHDEIGGSGTAVTRQRLADFTLLDLVDAGRGDSRPGLSWDGAGRMLERAPEIVVVRRAHGRADASGPDAAELVLYEEDGWDRSLEILALWIAARGPRAVDPPVPGGRLPAASDDGHAPGTADALEEILVQRQAVHGFCDALVHQDDPVRMMESFTRAISDFHGVARFVLFIRDLDRPDTLEPMCSTGIDPESLVGLRLSLRSGIGRMVRIRHAAVRGDALRGGSSVGGGETADRREAVRELDALGADAALPVSDQGRLCGILLIGRRMTGEPVAAGQVEVMVRMCERIGAALQAVRARHAVEESHRLDCRIVGRLPAGVIVAEESGAVVRLNDGAWRILGLPELPRPITLRDLPAYLADRIRGAFDSEAAAPAVDLRDPVRDVVVRLRCARWRDEEGNRVLALLEDRTEEAERRGREEGRWRHELIGRFAERASHELANTLVSLRTFAELLPERHDDARFREEFAAVVGDEVSRMQRFLDNLDLLGRDLDPPGETVDLAVVIDAVAAELREEFGGRVRDDGVTIVRGPGGRPVEVEIDAGADAARVEGSEELLRTALRQLARNAVQAMARGGTVRIGLRAVADQEGERVVEMTVADEGKGILLAHLERAFEPFFTTQHVGPGLGLAVARRIVEAHRGHVSLDSTRGSGTRATIVLPVHRLPRDAGEPAAARAEVEPLAGPAREPRIELPEPGPIRSRAPRPAGEQEGLALT